MKGESGIENEVMHAAEHGARSAALGHIEIINEAKCQTVLHWQQRIHQGRPPVDPKAWAFITAKHRAYRILKNESCSRSIDDATADMLITPSEESAILDRMSSPAIDWLRATDGIQAINQLVSITTRIIGASGDPIDARILHLHYREHWTFVKIAAAINISEDSARQRWSRLIGKVIDKIIGEIKKDSKLAKIFQAIIEDRDDFRISILGLLSIISSKGLAALHEAIESILPV